MQGRLLSIFSISVLIAASAFAQSYQRRAQIVGGGSPDRGWCTVEVLVDGAAEVELRGDTAILSNLSGQPPLWRRFECTSVMPPNVASYHFNGAGRGQQELIRDPRNGGVAVVRIEDPEAGPGEYRFDVSWDTNGNYTAPKVGGYPESGTRQPGYRRRMPADEAIRVCEDSIVRQAEDRLRTSQLSFDRVSIDDNPGRSDWVNGTFAIHRYDRDEWYRFSCSVDLETGIVRSSQFESAAGAVYRPYGDEVSSGSVAIQTCERSVEQRIRRDGYNDASFERVNIENRPGRNGWIAGSVRGEGRYRAQWFDFACSANLDDGSVRLVDLTRR
jgi:hypothetical protein